MSEIIKADRRIRFARDIGGRGGVGLAVKVEGKLCAGGLALLPSRMKSVGSLGAGNGFFAFGAFFGGGSFSDTATAVFSSGSVGSDFEPSS